MIIAPSILSMDFTEFTASVHALNFNADWIHFDVMDGHFVPNISFGPYILNTFRKVSPLFLDVHIMVSDPEKYADVFIDNGADSVVFHYEALDKNINRCRDLLKHIKSRYVKAGISINPDTDVESIASLLNDADIVLIMSVYPGFGGQSFIDSAYKKIRYLANYKKENNLNYIIEVDGGVNDKNAHDLARAGADAIVAGSYVFNGDIKANINKLRKATNLHK